ncbi:hypothetical protein ACWFMI_14620 [Nocardiopsis terrae]
MGDSRVLPLAEGSIDDALGEALVPEQRKPIRAWDGVRHTWILRRHDKDSLVYREVIIALEEFPAYAAGTEEVKSVTLSLTASAWSMENRRAAQHKEIYARSISEQDDFPSPKRLQGLIGQAWSEAEGMAGDMPQSIIKINEILGQMEQ